jgi:hypothetical protein
MYLVAVGLPLRRCEREEMNVVRKYNVLISKHRKVCKGLCLITTLTRKMCAFEFPKLLQPALNINISLACGSIIPQIWA